MLAEGQTPLWLPDRGGRPTGSRSARCPAPDYSSFAQLQYKWRCVFVDVSLAAKASECAGKAHLVARALAFTQAIPYQKGRRGADAGFQHPLALVARNKGDCDGKSALFLALVRAELPALPLAMVYVPGHALVGVGLPPKPGDRTFQHRGTEYVYAEPVGPAAHPLGSPAKANRRAGKRGVIRLVPR